MSKRPILVVEDEFIIAELIKESLSNAGYNACVHASTLAEALDAANDLDLLGALLDINLQGELVFPVAEALQSRKIPFAFSSGLGDTKKAPEQFSGATLLMKPWNDGALEALASDVFGPPG